MREAHCFFIFKINNFSQIGFPNEAIATRTFSDHGGQQESPQTISHCPPDPAPHRYMWVHVQRCPRDEQHLTEHTPGNISDPFSF